MRTAKQLDWNRVKLLVLMDLDGQKLVRAFDDSGNEFWLSPGSEPQFVGMNEPPDFGTHKQLRGEEAKVCANDFLK